MGRLLIILSLVAAIIVLTGGSFTMAVSGEGLDDAYISYRFSHNLAEGHGLVFNPGERVEGYSNFLYVLMLAPAFLFGVPLARIYDVSVALNILASIGLLSLLVWYLHARYGRLAAIVGGLLFGACPTIWYWNASGLETSWVMFLQFAGIVSADRYVEGRGRAALFFSALACLLLVLIRADGFVSGFLITFYLALRRCWKGAAIVGGATGAALLGLILWRLSYYGHPLPNTYYAKVAGPLIDRLRYAVTRLLNSRNLWLYWLVLLFYAVPVLWRAVRDRSLGKIDSSLVLGLGILVYYFYVGGDFFNERMLIVHVPIAILGLFAAGIVKIDRLELKHLVVPLALFAFQFAVPDYRASRMDDLLMPEGRDSRRSSWSLLGEHLRLHEPGATLATDAAGKIPFFSGLPTIDMLGLCDAHIAQTPIHGRFWAGHSKYDPEYIMDRSPDLIASLLLENGGMGAGLGRRWQQHGYRPMYVCSRFDRLPPGLPKVIDISDKTIEEILQLRMTGYDFVVVKKTSEAGNYSG